MKNGLGLLVCALILLTFASTAQSDDARVSGSFTFDLGTAAGTVSVSGEGNSRTGTATGQISLHATMDISGETCQQVNVGTEENPDYRDVCEPTGNTQPTPVQLDLLMDRMVATNNRAAMSGTITGDSPFAGLHTILAVETVGSNDGFTWGVYKTKLVNQNAKDYDFCQSPPDPNLCENSENCPTPSCFCDGTLQCQGEFCQCIPGATLTYTASDYELCPYPPPTDACNFLDPYPCPGGDPHNYTCSPGASDPNGRAAGIPVEATQTITTAESFPLFAYPMTPVPHGGGNQISVR